MRSNNEIIELIDGLREERGLSISELARRVGMAKSALSRYFNKTREFPLNRVEDFSKALGVNSEYILGFEESDKTIEKTVEIMKLLNADKKQKVYTYATEQLNEQNKEKNEKVVAIPVTDKESPEVNSSTPFVDIAAHAINDDEPLDEEEITMIARKAIEEFEKKRSKKE